MTEGRINFSKEDIGAEILPILTSGLYKDTLDALREYIQNAIDAKCKSIQITINPDLITIVDDGEGMSGSKAKNAMRFGISDKNPQTHVGFRGIGIYSSFHLCQKLEIYTKAETDPNTYKISFDFEKIRNDLLKERELRKEGNPPSLYLEKLLENSIRTEIEREFVLNKNGTTVILTGLLPEAYARLNDWESVATYLQNVVPLPFSPSFTWKQKIEEKFTERELTFTPISLQINQKREDLFRPYVNDIFKKGGKNPPNFKDLSNGQNFGFLWYCVNDANSTLKDENIRGILIKAKGCFSVGDRKYLEPYFGRPVISRRITGELVITNNDLIPNAARSDFENNSTRQAFLEKLPKVIREIDKVATKIQDQERAKEVLYSATDVLEKINTVMLTSQRDRDLLVKYMSILEYYSDELDNRAPILKAIEPTGFSKTQELLTGCRNFITAALDNEKMSREQLEKEIINTVQREAEYTDSPTTAKITTSLSLNGLIEEFGITENNGFIHVLELIDIILKEQLKTDDYNDFINELRSRMEENS